jgi:hypothetical protein
MLVDSVMSRSVVTTEPLRSVQSAARLMRTGLFRHLPVLVHGHLAGMVSDRDISITGEQTIVQVMRTTGPRKRKRRAGLHRHQLLQPAGFCEKHTNEPNVAMHASNLLLVRVGDRVTAEREAALDEALFIAPWQRREIHIQKGAQSSCR